MHKIEFGNITREFPENISEMTAPQYRYFAYLEMLRQSGKITMERLEVLFIYFVLNMVRTTDGEKAIENITLLRQLVKPYFVEQRYKGKVAQVVDLNFLNNPLPVIQCGRKKLYGPADALQDCSYEEVFIHGQNALIEFSNTRESSALDNLVAALYRPKKRSLPWEKKKRPRFDPETMEDVLPLVQQLRPEIKFGVYLFFASCQKFITTADALDIGGGTTVNVAQLFKPDPSQKSGAGIGSVGIIYSLAESGVFGDAKETARQGVYDVLIRMVQLHEQAKEMKRHAKRK